MNNIRERGDDKDEITLLDYWKALMRRKTLVGAIAGTAFVLSAIISLLLPKMYDSTARIMPPEQKSPLGSPTLLSQMPAGLIGLVRAFTDTGMSASSKLWAEILSSESVEDAIIRRFGLMRLYGEDTMEDTRKKLGKRVDVSVSKNGILSVTVEDADPRRASEMANAFVEELDRVNQEVSSTSGNRTRVFIGKRLAVVKDDLSKSEYALKEFEDKNNAIKIDDQTKTIVEAVGKAKGELMAKEVELNTLLSYATPANPRVAILNTQIKESREQLRRLEEEGGAGRGLSKDVIIPTSSVPGLSMQYARLLRDAKLEQTLYELLVSQYEGAKIEELNDTPTVVVLDPASVPTKKAKPRRALIVAASTAAGVLLAAFLSLFLENIGVSRVERR